MSWIRPAPVYLGERGSLAFPWHHTHTHTLESYAEARLLNLSTTFEQGDLTAKEKWVWTMIDRRGSADQAYWIFFFFFVLFLLSCFSFPEFCKYLRVWVAFWPPVPKIMVPKCQCKNQINNHRLLNSQNNPCSLPRRVWADNWARGGSAVKINLCNPALGKISLVFRSQGKGLHNPAFPSVTVLTAVTSTGLMIKPSRQNHKDRPCPLPSVSTEKSNLEKRIYR